MGFFSMPSQRADFAAAILSPTTRRKEVVDFIPIFPQHISFIYKTSNFDVISNIQELVYDRGVKFIAVMYGANAKYFLESRHPIAQKIYQRMEVCDTVNGSYSWFTSDPRHIY